MFKEILAPVEHWLIASGRCFHCGALLAETGVWRRRDGQRDELVCQCGKIYIWDKNRKHILVI